MVDTANNNRRGKIAAKWFNRNGVVFIPSKREVSICTVRMQDNSQEKIAGAAQT